MTSSTYGATESVSSPAVSITLLRSADSRFGMLSSLPAASVSSGSRTLQISRSRTTTLSSPDNFLAPSSVSSTTAINGSTWTSTYDAATRVLTSRTPAGRQTTATFDAKGRPVTAHVPLLADAVTAYDARGRITTMTRGSRTTLFAYDSSDRVASITDPLQRTVSFTYDDGNHVTSKTLADGRTIGYTYDAAGNVTSVTPPSRPAHLFTFTGINFLEAYTVPGSAATRYRYNRDRQVTSMTRPDGTEITNHYDTAGRLSSVSTPSGNFALSYSANTGLVETVTAPSGIATHYTYDGFLPAKIDSTGIVNGSISIAYDGDLRVTSKTIGSTAPITYGYDSDGLLTAIGLEAIARDAANGRVTTTAAGVINDVRAYDEFGQISDYTARLNATPIFSQHYTRDAGGRIASIDETIGSTTTARASTTTRRDVS